MRRHPDYSTTRCVDGRLMRHDSQPDDPYLETDIGKCPECKGKGCEQAANVNLIAAAPDMLAALKQLEAALKNDSRQKSILGDTVEYHLNGETMYDAINRVRVTIAKAEGREP